MSHIILFLVSMLVILIIPITRAAPLVSGNLSINIEKNIITDNNNHETVKISPETYQAKASHQMVQFNALRQASLIVNQLVQQSRQKPIKTHVKSIIIAESAKDETQDIEKLIDTVKTDVDTLNHQLELPKNSVVDMKHPTSLAVNDIQESSVYQPDNGLSFGDNYKQVKDGYSYWFSAKTFSGTLQESNTMPGLKARGETYTASLESSIMSGMLFGVAMTLGKNRIDDEFNDGKNDISFVNGSLYSAWKIGDGFLEAGITAGRARNKTSRMATMNGNTGHLESMFYANTMHARLLAGNVYHLASTWTLTPLAELNYNRVGFEKRQEKWASDCQGACTAPTTDHPKALSTMEGGFGFNLASQWGNDSIKLAPFASVMGYYNFRDRQTSMRAVYTTGIDQMIVTSPERNRGRIRVNFGISMIVNDRLNLNLGIVHNQMKGYKANSANLKFRYAY
ncbi:MAG: autotransporter outer membrane beta-barrel domain-containing protein [Endozoicomonadaceae bacterium]|nr:autotransporter outer membrane beta-barrel domain-containing protein [Endozoicomonadaceae bacterium]